MGLIVSAYKADKQLDLIRYSKIGYDDEYSVVLPLTNDLRTNFDEFKKEVKLDYDIINAKIENSSVINNDSTIEDVKKGSNAFNNVEEVINIRFKPRHIADNIMFIGRIWEKYEKGSRFEYLIVDSDLRKEFRTEVIMSRLLNAFSIAATFITLLGLFCLSSYISEQRKSEIAIRKTFGASTLSIYFLLVKEFIIISSFAIITAHIVVTFAVGAWVKRFAYRIIDYGISEYLIPTIMALVLIILTVSINAILASRKEPAEVLKRE